MVHLSLAGLWSLSNVLTKYSNIYYVTYKIDNLNLKREKTLIEK